MPPAGNSLSCTTSDSVTERACKELRRSAQGEPRRNARSAGLGFGLILCNLRVIRSLSDHQGVRKVVEENYNRSPPSTDQKSDMPCFLVVAHNV